MKLLGLIGYPLEHSFSPAYFADKFASEGISDWTYRSFPLPEIEAFPKLWEEHPDLRGLNVTIPHKQAVIPYLDNLSPEAEAVGAVNTILKKAGRLHGHNTDIIGFSRGLEQLLQGAGAPQALILGTGGASRAVAYVLRQKNIPYRKVSRNPGPQQLSYAQLTPKTIQQYPLIINTTPLGTYPETGNCPKIPYEGINSQHYLYDLVYNPAKTLFLKKGITQNAKTINGLPMLLGQAEAAWDIWQQD